MIIREDVQNRIDFLEGEVARLAAQTECFHRKAQENELAADRHQAELKGLRFAAGLDGAGGLAPEKPRQKVLVQPGALEALAAEPMNEEALIAVLRLPRRPVETWITRALRKGKIKKREDDCLEVVG